MEIKRRKEGWKMGKRFDVNVSSVTRRKGKRKREENRLSKQI